jgi:hypothetical protein
MKRKKRINSLPNLYDYRPCRTMKAITKSCGVEMNIGLNS